MSLIQVGAVAAGILHVVMTQALAVSLLSLAVLGVVLYGKLSGTVAPATANPIEPTRAVRLLVWTMGLLVIPLTAFLAWQAYIKPDPSWDGMSYHIPIMHFWAQEGYIHLMEHPPALGTEGIENWLLFTDRVFNGFPFGVETCAWIFCTALNNSAFTFVGNWLYAPLGLLGLVYLTRILGATPVAAWAAGFLFLLLPVTVQQSMTALVDTAFASAVIAMFALSTQVIRGFTSGKILWKSALPLGTAMGLVLGSKVSGPVLVVFSLSTLFGVCLIISLGTAAGRGAENQARVTNRKRLFMWGWLFFSLAFGACMLVGGYWTVRNYVYHGNPMWPARITVGEQVLFPYSGDPDYAVSDTMYPLAELWLQGGPVKWPASLRGHGNWEGGWGYLWLVGALPAIAVVVLRQFWKDVSSIRKRGLFPVASPLAWLLPLILVSAAALVMVPGAGRARYSYWIYGLGLPCFVLLAERALRISRRWNRPWTFLPFLWVFLCICIAVYEGLYCAAWNATKPYPWHNEGWRWPRFRETPSLALNTLIWHDPIGWVMPHMSCTVFDEILRGTDNVAFQRVQPRGPTRLVIGQLAQPLGARRIYFIGNETLSNEAALRKELVERQIRYVIAEYKYQPPQAALGMAFRCHLLIPHLKVLEYDLQTLQLPPALPQGSPPI